MAVAILFGAAWFAGGRVRSRAQYERGIALYRSGEDAAAVRELEQVRSAYEQDREFQRIYRSARVNEAWAAADYVAYLKRAEELHALFPNDEQAVMSMAAGNAYRYAQTGDPRSRAASERFLARLATMDHELDEPIANVRSCLETRVIIRD